MKAVLLIIDVQAGLLEQHPFREGPFLETLRDLLSFFREHRLPVAYVRHDDGPQSDLSYSTPAWEIGAPVAPLPGEPIFDKRFNSAFLHTGLREFLKTQKADTLIVTGMQTELCIDATVKSAFEQGYSVILPTDGAATFDNDMFTAAQLNPFFFYKIWKGRFGEILTPAQIKERLVPRE